MKVYCWIILMVMVVLLALGCRSKKQVSSSRDTSYQPIFNQLGKEYVKIPEKQGVVLDTSVCIRSNLRPKIYTVKQKFVVDHVFEILSGDLAIPIEIINEKPPKFDTFLVAKEYLFHVDMVDLLFPPKYVEPDTISSADTLMGFLSADSVIVVKKKYFSTIEIKSDTSRVITNFDSIVFATIEEAPWKISDSIPYVKGVDVYFLDSLLLLCFDTVKVKRFVPEDVVPMLPFNVMVEEKKKMFIDSDTIVVDVPVSILFFYPEEIDVFIDMVKVEGGTFKMGSNEHDEDERPATNLTVSSFLLSKYEINNEVFSYFLNENDCDSLGQIDGLPVIDLKSEFTKIFQSRTDKKFYANTGFEKMPVLNVTWIGAQMFCNAAQNGDLRIRLSPGFTSQRSAEESRLPSEAEWEYAARGGVYATRYYVGVNKDDFEYENLYAGGNYMGSIGYFVDNSQGYCHVGGRFKPNELGLYDMSGNLWEWCYDKYKSDFLARNGTSNNPINMEGGGQRVAKGGSWSSDAMYCRITNRNYHNQFSTNPYLGFRLRKNW